MPSLRIPFPDKDNPSVVSLRGNRITVGRLPDNAIQIPDRTVSAHHAELISESGHYRVHDLGATNGLQVNGQLVTDFHLAEACKVTFGGVECEFSPETPAEDTVDSDKALVTRAEAAALKQETAKLQAQVTAFRQEVDALKQSHALRNGEATVPQAEFDRVTEELTRMALKVVETDRQLNQLRTELGVLRRDRENLQRALDEARLKASASPMTPAESGIEKPEEVPSATAANTAPPQVPDALLPVPPESPEEAQTAPATEVPAAEEPTVPPPAQTLTQPKPKPLFVPVSGSGEQAPAAPPRPQMPTAQPPKSPGQLQPAASARPGFAGSGLRPATFAKPAATPVAKPGTPVVKPAAPGAPVARPGASTFQGNTGLAAKAGLPTKPPMAAVPKAIPAGVKPAPAAAGPKGTQKLG